MEHTKLALACPKCGSTSITKAGSADGKKQVKCSNGHKVFEHLLRTTLAPEEPLPTKERAKAEWIKGENTRLKAEVGDLLQEIEQKNQLIELLENVKSSSLSPPKWLAPKKSSGKDRGIATLLLSDCHFDEVVSPDNINYVNSYNRSIAVNRLQKLFQNTIRLSTDYINGIQLEGLVLALGGDIVSGLIHEELEETNDDRILPTCLFWADQLAAGIDLLLEHFDNIYIPCVVGNHGRLYKKPRYKYRAQDNYDWLIYKLLERHYADRKESRVTFDIATSSEARWTLYNTSYQLTHGDQFRGGSGIGGLAVPIMRGDAKKRKAELAVHRPYDILLMGHWHQYMDLGSIIVNGSLIGANEYSLQNNLEFQLPVQAFWITDPKHGKTICAPVRVLDPSVETWVAHSPIKTLF